MTNPVAWCRRTIVISLIVGAAAAVAAAGDALPVFRQGMWEFTRTVEAKPLIVVRKCTNPTDDMKKQNDMLTKQGCKFSPVIRTGNVYSFTADCQIGGVSGQTKSVLTSTGDTGYRVDIEARQGGAKTAEVLVAKRTGDCAAPLSGR